MTKSQTKPRARRLASDEAHAWARSVPLHNPLAKSVLAALTLYVNGEGTCFVGLNRLAEDCDMSVNTIRRRLVWLDQVGAIVRRAQWVDEYGQRNSDGRGKCTTDEIRLLLDADLDEIAATASGSSSSFAATDEIEISPSSVQGLNAEPENSQPSVSSRLAVAQPSQSWEGLISEPEPEPENSPPGPPLLGIEKKGFGRWEGFERVWQEPIQNIVRPVWSALTADEKAQALKVANGYVARRSQEKPPNPVNAHTFLRERKAWSSFAALVPQPGAARPPGALILEIESSDGRRARGAMRAIFGLRPPAAVRLGEKRDVRGVMCPEAEHLAACGPLAFGNPETCLRFSAALRHTRMPPESSSRSIFAAISLVDLRPSANLPEVPQAAARLSPIGRKLRMALGYSRLKSRREL